MFRVKRVYDPAEDSDGKRYLVDRLWPRGIRREAARLDDWLKDLAPSETLRREFHHSGERFEDFREHYRAELADPARNELVSRLVREAAAGPVTLLFAAKDTERNNAVVLREFLEGARG